MRLANKAAVILRSPEEAIRRMTKGGAGYRA